MSPMIHSVYFWLDETLTDDQKREFAEEGLRSLTAIDIIASGEYGAPALTTERPVTDHSFDFALFLRFANLEDQAAYQVHPAHEIFVNRFSPWFREVKVYDTAFA